MPAPADLVMRPLGPRPVGSEPVRLALTLASEVAFIVGYVARLDVGVVIPAILFIAVSLVALIVEPHVVRGLEGFAEPVAASRNPFRPTRWYRLSPSGKPSQPSP